MEEKWEVSVKRVQTECCKSLPQIQPEHASQPEAASWAFKPDVSMRQKRRDA